MQCKDIDELPILQFLNHLEGAGNWGGREQPNSVRRVMPPGLDDNLVHAKMRQMIANGFVEGCGCRGDFSLAPGGLRFLETGERPVRDKRPSAYQPIYGVPPSRVFPVFEAAASRFERASEWGYRDPGDVYLLVMGAKPQGDALDLSSVVQRLRAAKTGKLIGSANRAIYWIEHHLKLRRVVVNAGEATDLEEPTCHSCGDGLVEIHYRDPANQHPPESHHICVQCTSLGADPFGKY